MGNVNCRLSSFHRPRHSIAQQGKPPSDCSVDHAKCFDKGKLFGQTKKAVHSKRSSLKAFLTNPKGQIRRARVRRKEMMEQSSSSPLVEQIILISDDEDNISIDSDGWNSVVDNLEDIPPPHELESSGQNVELNEPPNPEELVNEDGGFGEHTGHNFQQMTQSDLIRGSSQQPSRRQEEMPGTTALALSGTAIHDKMRIDKVVDVFPGICPEHVSELYANGVAQEAEVLIAYILDQQEKGIQYPLARDKLKTLKRKRELDDEAEDREYGNVDRALCGSAYGSITRDILSSEFPTIPMHFIDKVLAGRRYHLYPSYKALEEAQKNLNIGLPAYSKLKQSRKAKQSFLPEAVETALKSAATSSDKMLALRELQAARKARRKAEDKDRAEKKAALDEENNLREAQEEGQMAECGCCFTEYPLNRMVHCDNEDILHWFCRPCAKRMAEAEVGNSKFELRCMSMDGCDSVFRRDQTSQFLDATTLIALERNEQEAMLRMAGIENLASCPFCPFAAEYPPIAQDRLFRCQAPDCEKVSCRMCNLESHVPKSCEENRKENGLSIRREIEEAMSAALIRKCNKCGTPFVKEEGCNKMTCTRPGCRNIQCYVCSKSCHYDHFDDRTRGGRAGNCPLFENVHERHEQEVKRAEKIAMDKVRAEHPEYTEDDLQIRLSENVKRDEERRKNYIPPPPFVAGLGPGMFGGVGAPFGPPAGFPFPQPPPMPQFLPGFAYQPPAPAPPVRLPGEEAHDQFGVREDDLQGLFGPLAEVEFAHMRRGGRFREMFQPQGVQQNIPGPPLMARGHEARGNENQPPAAAGNPAAFENYQRQVEANYQRRVEDMRARLGQLRPAVPAAAAQQQVHRQRR